MAAVIPFLPIISTAFTVISAISAGNNAKRQGDYNAAIAQRNAMLATSQAAADAALQQRDAARRIGSARAAYGASGITMEGSPLDVLTASAAQAELDKQNILAGGARKAIGYQETGALDKSRGAAAQQESYWKAGSSILMGTSDYYAKQPTRPVLS